MGQSRQRTKQPLRFYPNHQYPPMKRSAHRRGIPNRRNKYHASHPRVFPLNTPALPAQNSMSHTFGIAQSSRTDRTSLHAANTRTGHNALQLQHRTMCSTEVCSKVAALETGGATPRSLPRIRGVDLRLPTRLRSLRATGPVVDQTGGGYPTKAGAQKILRVQGSGHLLICLPVQLTTRSVSVLQVLRERFESRPALHYGVERTKPRRGLSLGQIGRKTSPTEEDHPHQGIRRTRRSWITSLNVDVSGEVTVSRVGALRSQLQAPVRRTESSPRISSKVTRLKPPSKTCRMVSW